MLLTTRKYAGEQERSVQSKKLWEVNMANNMADAGVYNCACSFVGVLYIDKTIDTPSKPRYP